MEKQTTLSSLPAPACYPFRSAEELADFLISHGLVESDAWYDADGWDRGQTEEQIYRAWRQGSEHQSQVICRKCGLREERGEKPDATF